MKLLHAALSLGVLTALASPAAAQNVGEVSSSTNYAAFYSLDHGFESRRVVGNFTDLYRGKIGLHSDVAYVQREDSGLFVAGGLSYALSSDVRAKAMIGTSTKNDGILPELFASSSIQFKPHKGWTVTPDVAYRKYRTGDAEVAPSVTVARYFNMPNDHGYFVAQVDSGLSIVKDTPALGWSLGADLTTVRSSGWSFGANARVGRMAYDTITGGGRLPVRSSIAAAGLKLGRRLSARTELFARFDITQTDLYFVRGGSLGLKLGL